jgi:predicted SAM-dependent methyltransferase
LLAKTPIIRTLGRKTLSSNSGWDVKVKFKNILKMKLQPNSVQVVYSSHLLEHLYYNQCEQLLQKLHYSMIEGGIIRLALPDYDAFIRKFIKTFESNPLIAMQEFEGSLLSHPLIKPSIRTKLWNQITGNLHIHRWHPNFAVVQEMLLKIGFTSIERCQYRESSLEEINHLENREFMTFYIEAKK